MISVNSNILLLEQYVLYSVALNTVLRIDRKCIEHRLNINIYISDTKVVRYHGVYFITSLDNCLAASFNIFTI